MVEREEVVTTADGGIQTFICHPERSTSPVVMLFMDAYGIREELRDMSRRLGTSGYYVMLPNLYYRTGAYELGPIPEPGDQRRIDRLTACVQSLTIATVLQDTAALLGYADADPATRKGPIGCLGYCMSGRFAIGAAARFPERVAAAASIYGTWLVSDDPLSPHRAACQARAELYFACAEEDHWAPLEVIEKLRQALSDCGANAEVEIFRAVEHGFAFKSRAAYDRRAEERHWERLIALFRRNLHHMPASLAAWPPSMPSTAPVT